MLDEMISGQVADRLRQRGHDAIAVTAEPTLRGCGDPEIFLAAQSQRRAVVTYNRADFQALVDQYGQQGRDHHGLVIVNPKRHPNDQFSRLVNSLEKLLGVYQAYPGFVTWLKE